MFPTFEKGPPIQIYRKAVSPRTYDKGSFSHISVQQLKKLSYNRQNSVSHKVQFLLNQKIQLV